MLLYGTGIAFMHLYGIIRSFFLFLFNVALKRQTKMVDGTASPNVICDFYESNTEWTNFRITLLCFTFPCFVLYSTCAFCP